MTTRLRPSIVKTLFWAFVPIVLCTGCGSGSNSGSSNRLLLACNRTDGNSCYETYGDNSVSDFTGSCIPSSETSISACATPSAFGNCVTPVFGGTFNVYYYYNFGFPMDCSELGGTYTATGDQHIVGSGATAYVETNEISNSVSSTPEATGYTLNAAGIAISGTFEASSPTMDYFSFSSGSSSWFVIRTFVNGALSDVNTSYQCSGYSAMSNVNQEGRVGIPSNLTCNVYVSPTSAEASASYTIEMKSLP